MKYRYLLWLISLTFSIVVGYSDPGYADSGTKKTILVISDRLTLEDLKSPELPNLQVLMEKGSTGLVAPPTAGKRTPESVYASVGAGSSARGQALLNDAFSYNEFIESEHAKASDVYARRTGNRADDGSVLLITIGKLLRTNKDSGYRSSLGALGDAINRNGSRVALFGNSDLGDFRNRLAIAIAMDKQGYVPIGNVTDRLQSPGLSPTGKLTDVDKMTSAVTRALSSAAFVVVDFGDTARVDLSETSLSEEAYSKYKQAALQNLDSFVGRLLPIVDDTDTCLILAAFVPPSGRDWSKLTPFIVYGWKNQTGLLYSAATRTPGLISTIDVAPFVLKTLGFEAPNGMVGRGLTIIEHKNPDSELLWLQKIINRNARVQSPLFLPAAALGLLGLTILAAIIAFGGKPTRSTIVTVRAFMLFALSVPLGALVLARLQLSPVWYVVGVLIIAAFVTSFTLIFSDLVCRRAQRSSVGAMPMVVWSVIVAILIVIDGFLGGLFARFSAMPSFGFRYYGVGNEYMGLSIGAICVVAIWLFRSSSSTTKRTLLCIFALATLAIGFPGFGTNTGGAATAVVTFGLLYTAFSRGGIRLRDVIFMMGIAILVLVSFAVADLVVNGSAASHMGESLAATKDDGFRYLFSTAVRKMGMNFRQLGTRQGKLLLLGATPLAFLWFLGIQPKLVERVKQGLVGSGGKFVAVLIGTGTAVLSNDNGIIAGSLLLGPVVCAMLMSLTEETVAQDNGS